MVLKMTVQKRHQVAAAVQVGQPHLPVERRQAEHPEQRRRGRDQHVTA
jgi:hypothetical protein